jgi:hypothetical protein
MRIIKIVSPNNEVFSVEISGNEAEIKDLISILAGVAISDIKGIKDKYGNYYTLSFAINNNIINSDFSDCYYLVCASRTNQFKMKNLQQGSTNPSLYENDAEVSFNIRKAKSRTGSAIFSPTRNNNSSSFIEKCLSIIKDLDKLDDKNIPKLKQMLLNENEELCSLFRVYIQDLIDKKTLINSLNKILANPLDTDRPLSPTPQKNKFVKLIDSLEKSLSDNQSDITLLKNLIQYDNEFVLGAFEVYESDKDIENLIDSLRRSIKRYKKSTTTTNFIMHSNESKNGSNNELMDLRKVSVPETKTKTNFPFNKDIEKFLMSNLHTEQKIIMRYVLKNRTEEVDMMIIYYEMFGRTDVLLKTAKTFTKQFILETLAKNFSQSDKAKLEDLIINRNNDLITLFKSFNDHQSITQLEKDLSEVVRKQNPNSSDSEVDFSYREEFGKIAIVFMSALKDITTSNERETIKKMIDNKTPIVIELINEFSRTKNAKEVRRKLSQYFDKNNESIMDNRLILNKLEKSKHDTSINSSPMKNSISSPQHFSTFEKLLTELERTERISQNQNRYVLQRYKNNDEMLLSFWEVYTKNQNIEELIESIRIFSNSNKRFKSQITKTPLAIAKSKNEYIDFLKNKDISDHKEKEEIKQKQLFIIEMLGRESLLDKSCASLIIEMIKTENHLLISAFEIFSVTKDHWDFCETLNLITDIYKNNVVNKEESKKEEKNENCKIDSISKFEKFMIQNKYDVAQRVKLLHLYDDGEEFLMSAIEFYESSEDKDEFLDNLKTLLK